GSKRDWSSDVCSSDSGAGGHVAKSTGQRGGKGGPPLCPTGKHGRIKAQETCKKSGRGGGNHRFPPVHPGCGCPGGARPVDWGHEDRKSVVEGKGVVVR